MEKSFKIYCPSFEELIGGNNIERHHTLFAILTLLLFCWGRVHSEDQTQSPAHAKHALYHQTTTPALIT